MAASLVGLFAIFHGHAHGVEMPETISALAYGAGFVCATALLHATGLGLGIAIDKTSYVDGRRIAQISGTAITIAGVAISLWP